MEKLFSYGSLQISKIQKKLFDRILVGESDTLIDYDKTKIIINCNKYNIAFPKSEKKIVGVVYGLSNFEIKIADGYEGSQYKRIQVKLLSGAKCWLYVQR
ncbi:MAG: gamma-glutamylcyclotransferase family protein [Minisyncoccia bacterium]